MTADPIQQAAEVLDDHQRFGGTSDTAYRFTCTCDRYGQLYDHDTRVFAAHQAQALADAGLLPTETEWGTETGVGVVVVWPDEEKARGMHALLTAHPLRMRYTLTTPWKDAP